MTYRKMIAFGCAMILTLCGMAVAQQQGIGWHFDMMRGSAVANPGIPDPYEANMLVLYGFDNIPPTNNLGFTFDDSGNGLIAKPGNLSGYVSWPVCGTNSDGSINYGLTMNTYALRCVETSLWSSVVAPSVTSAYTLSVWIKRAVNNSHEFGWYDVGKNRKKMFTTAGNILFASLTNDVYDAIFNPANPYFATGSWCNMTITFSNNNFKAYTNGIQVFSDTAVSACPTGTLDYFAFYPYSSSIGDRYVLYSRLLTSQEVVTLVANTHPTNRIWRK